MNSVLLAVSASSILIFSILLIDFLLRMKIKRFVDRATQTDGVVIGGSFGLLLYFAGPFK